MSQPSIVEQYWTGVASQLQVEANVFNRLIGHNGEMGRANEIALSQLVTSLLPSSVGIGTGIVFDSKGGRSKQMDLIVFERASQPQIMAQSTQLLFPVETVHAVVEVKTTVDSEAIVDAGKKAESLRLLQPTDDSPIPLFGFFGYACSNAPSARAQELNSLPSDKQPDIACVLDPGLVGGLSDEGLNMGLVPLHALDASGVRQSRTWQTVPGGTPGPRLSVGGLNYPISRLAPNATQRYVFEPGRALLLFGKALLDSLAPRTTVQAGWLASYLPEVALEIVSPATS